MVSHTDNPMLDGLLVRQLILVVVQDRSDHDIFSSLLRASLDIHITTVKQV